MIFDGVNGVQNAGYYDSPYYGRLEGNTVTLYCDDFANDVTFGQTWQANLSTINPGSDLSQTRYGMLPDGLAHYEEAAWLTTQFSTQPTSQYADIQETIWQLFDTSAPAPTSNTWLSAAQTNYQGMNYSNFRVITNTGPVKPTGQVQEFLTSVPEPGSLALMGIGLLGIAALIRRSRRVSPNSEPGSFETEDA